MDPRTNGVACANRDCTYNDGRYEQNCKATTRDHGPWVVGCNQYLPDPMDLAVALNSPRPKPDMACIKASKSTKSAPS